MNNSPIRIKDDLYYDERSAGGIVFKQENGKTFWFIIKTVSLKVSKKKRKFPVYKFPKGHLKDGEFLKQAALREVEEEGRIIAKVVSKIGSNDYVLWDKIEKKKVIKKVTFFLMEYVGESNLKYFDQEIVVERGWYSFNEASKKLAFDSETVLLDKAKKRLESLIK
jgi:8-oxo-dGTP pyrophosphatase MutT (NUDIX family)